MTHLFKWGEVGLSVGGSFLKKLPKSPKRGQNEPFWTFLPFRGPKFVLKLPFFARFSVHCYGAPLPPEAPPTCTRATSHVNFDSWKKVRHLPPFGVQDWVNKAL